MHIFSDTVVQPPFWLAATGFEPRPYHAACVAVLLSCPNQPTTTSHYGESQSDGEVKQKGKQCLPLSIQQIKSKSSSAVQGINNNNKQ